MKFWAVGLAALIVLAGVGQSVASITTYSDRPSWDAAVGGTPSWLVDFEGFASDTSFRTVAVDAGPFSLLQETTTNHWGKMMFRWVYWNLLVRGRELPLPAEMTLYGKIR